VNQHGATENLRPLDVLGDGRVVTEGKIQDHNMTFATREPRGKFVHGRHRDEKIEACRKKSRLESQPHRLVILDYGDPNLLRQH
jgi:hypothetical protein